ncbi:hypothetical protein CR513_50753, partial [Mucuna pruriens]
MKYCLTKFSHILIFESLGVYVMHTIDLDKKTSLVIEVKNFLFLTNVSNAQDDSNPFTQVLWNDDPPLIDESIMGMHDKRESKIIGESVGMHKM